MHATTMPRCNSRFYFFFPSHRVSDAAHCARRAVHTRTFTGLNATLSTEDKSKLSAPTVLQLIMEFLAKEGLHNVVKTLEEESQVSCNHAPSRCVLTHARTCRHRIASERTAIDHIDATWQDQDEAQAGCAVPTR
jgi:hypothetical protein